jgi:hypothetical protein
LVLGPLRTDQFLEKGEIPLLYYAYGVDRIRQTTTAWSETIGRPAKFLFFCD